MIIHEPSTFTQIFKKKRYIYRKRDITVKCNLPQNCQSRQIKLKLLYLSVLAPRPSCPELDCFLYLVIAPVYVSCVSSSLEEKNEHYYCWYLVPIFLSMPVIHRNRVLRFPFNISLRSQQKIIQVLVATSLSKFVWESACYVRLTSRRLYDAETYVMCLRKGDFRNSRGTE